MNTYEQFTTQRIYELQDENSKLKLENLDLRQEIKILKLRLEEIGDVKWIKFINSKYWKIQENTETKFRSWEIF